MEPWAKRMQDRMAETGHTQADIARACGIQPGSVSGWFGQGKPTKMISGDNLVASAILLGTSAEYLMTGKGPRRASSQPVGLDVAKLNELLGTLEAAVEKARVRLPPRVKARLVASLYADQEASAASTPQAVESALIGILATMESTHEPDASR